jgi:hypothetical protein
MKTDVQLSWWESRAIESSAWNEYLLASLEEKERRFQQWLIREPLTVNTPSLKKRRKTRRQNNKAYAFMRACVWRLVNSKYWYDYVMQEGGEIERLKQRHVVDVEGIVKQFNVAANNCPNSREKHTLCAQFTRLLPNAE